MSEHNLFQEIAEDLERQKWEDLWKRYGNLVIAGALAIVLGTAASTFWRSYHTDQAQAATAALVEIVAGSSDETKKVEALNEFSATHQSMALASLAKFRVAQLAIKAGNTDEAIKAYDSVAADSNADPAFRQLADLLSIRAQMDNGNPAVLEKRLQPLLANNAPWRYEAMESDAFLSLRAGNKNKAKQIFTELSQDAEVPQSLNVRAGDMLRYLSE